MAGGGNARLELEFSTPADKMNLVGEPPLHDKFGIEGALLLAPGRRKSRLYLSACGEPRAGGCRR